MLVRSICSILIALFAVVGCGNAQVAPTTMPADASAPAAAPSAPTAPSTAASSSIVDQTLDQLDALGEGLRDFSADVSLTETDALVGDSVTRAGKVGYTSKPDGDAMIRVTFDTRQVADEQPKPEKLEYALRDGWLIERDYRRKTEVNRQVRRPGEKMNLIKLGEGPFPLPIGQKREEVLRLFDVAHIDPAAGDPEGATVHLRLDPRPDTQFARQFDRIDVWVDRESHMPRRIETTDAGGNTVRTTELNNTKVNTGLSESDLALPPIDDREWTRHDEPFENG